MGPIFLRGYNPNITQDILGAGSNITDLNDLLSKNRTDKRRQNALDLLLNSTNQEDPMLAALGQGVRQGRQEGISYDPSMITDAMQNRLQQTQQQEARRQELEIRMRQQQEQQVAELAQKQALAKEKSDAQSQKEREKQLAEEKDVAAKKASVDILRKSIKGNPIIDAINEKIDQGVDYDPNMLKSILESEIAKSSDPNPLEISGAKAAQEYHDSLVKDYTKDIGDMENLNEMSKVLDKYLDSGYLGQIKALTFGDENFSELMTRSLQSLGSPLHAITNGGVISDVKLKFASEKLMPNANESAASAKAKMKSLIETKKAVLGATQSMIELIRKYGSLRDIPLDDLQKVSLEANRSIDSALSFVDKKEEKTIEKPSQGDVGAIYKGPDGKFYKNNGKAFILYEP